MDGYNMSARRRAVKGSGSLERNSQENVHRRSASLQPQTRVREIRTTASGDMMSPHRPVTSDRRKTGSENGDIVKASSQILEQGGTETGSADKDVQSVALLENHLDSSSNSEEDSSIALDCHTGPSEVIVKGKNVRQIHVKFPPRPPSGEVEGVHLRSSAQRQTSHLSLTNHSMSSGQQPQEHGDDFEYKPLSQGGRRSPPRSLPPALPAITDRSNQSAVLGTDPLRDSGMLSAISLDLGLNSGAYEWDRKVKHDIISGIEYFEKKNQEMKEVNSRMLRELERIARQNAEYEDKLRREQERSKVLNAENDEMKIKLDTLEKENGRLKEESVSYWNARVKSEELYMELKRDTEKETRILRDQVETKEKEVIHLRGMNMKGQKHDKTSKYLADDHLELLHKISRLEEEIARMKIDKERVADSNKRQKDEVDGMRKKLKEQSTELENRFSQFLVLKKSFNDLNSENEKIKSQLRTRRSTQQLTVNNNTWPKNNDLKKTEADTAVSYFDIPSKVGKAGTKKTSVPLLGHKRNTSDSHSTTSESLPPVPSPSK